MEYFIIIIISPIMHWYKVMLQSDLNETLDSQNTICISVTITYDIYLPLAIKCNSK